MVSREVFGTLPAQRQVKFARKGISKAPTDTLGLEIPLDNFNDPTHAMSFLFVVQLLFVVLNIHFMGLSCQVHL